VIETREVGAFLGEEHEARATHFAESAARLLSAAPSHDDEEARSRAVELARSLGSDGWFGPIGEADWRGCCLARERLAYHSPLADNVFAIQGLCATPISLAGSVEARERWIDALISGRAVGGFAMTEPDAGSDVSALATRAEAHEDGWVLNGRKTLISNAGIADVYVVFASTDPEAGTRGISAFVVPADTPGLRFAGAQVLSAPHPLGDLALEDCRVGGEALLGNLGEGFKIGMSTLDRLRATVGAAACGMAARAADEAIRHARAREQFGKPLAEQQLVQEKIARMSTELTAARLLVYRAAWEKDRGAERITLEAAMAKSYATEAAQRIVDDAVQILGGRGVLRDHPVDHLYRSVRALRIYEGATEIQHLIIAGQVLKRAAEAEA
jgi:acyl-CoA dehydrogenase